MEPTVASTLACSCIFFNLVFHYNEKFNADLEVKKGLYDALERFVQDNKTLILVDEQIDHFKRKIGMFGRDAQLMTKTKTTSQSTCILKF